MFLLKSKKGLIFINKNRIFIKYSFKLLLNLNLLYNNIVKFEREYIELKDLPYIDFYEEFVGIKSNIFEKRDKYSDEFGAMKIICPLVIENIKDEDLVDFEGYDDLLIENTYYTNNIKIEKENNFIKLKYKKKDLQILIYMVREIINFSNSEVRIFINNEEIDWDFGNLYEKASQYEELVIEHKSDNLNYYSLKVNIKGQTI